MKKAITILLSLILISSLVGCTTQTERVVTPNMPPSSEQATESTTATPLEPQVKGPEISAQQLLQNINARKAIALAIDKRYITMSLMRNGSKAVDYLVPNGLSVSEDGVDFRDAQPTGWNHNDIMQAVEYWNKARAELKFDTVKLRLLTFDSAAYKKISQYIKQQLEEHLDGIEVVLIQQPFNNKMDLAKQGKFDIEYTGWAPDYPDVMSFLDIWVTDGGYNTAGYSNASYDGYIERTKNGDLTNDLPARTALLQQAEQLLIEDDCIVVPLYQRSVSLLQSPKVQGIIRHKFGGAYSYAQATTKNFTEGKQIIRLLSTSDIPTMDHSKATDTISLEVMANVLEGLTTLGAGDQLLPGGAESWQVSQDGTVYTFNLAKDAVWSNGVPVTASDYVYAWRRLADPATQSQYQSMIETAKIANYQAVISGAAPPESLGVVALDDYTLQVKLEMAVPYFLKLMSFPSFYPLNQAFVEAQGERFGTSSDSVLYNGPYIISQWQSGYGYSLTKNESYWKKATVLNDGITFRVVKDTLAGVNLYEKGEVDRAEIKGEFVEQYLDHPHFKIEEDVAIFYLVFNVGNY